MPDAEVEELSSLAAQAKGKENAARVKEKAEGQTQLTKQRENQ